MFPAVSVTPGNNGWVDQQGVYHVCEGQTFTLALDAPFDSGIQWFNNGTMINGATASTYGVTSAGSFTVTGAPAQCPNAVQTLSESIDVVFYPPTVPVIELANDTLFATPAADTGYHWMLNGTPIPGATNYWHIPTSAGTYTAQLNDVGGCNAISNPVIISSTNDLTLNPDWHIYPNPATDELILSRTGNQVLRYTIYDVTGKASQAGEVITSLSVAELANGIYMLVVETEGGLVTRSFVKD